MYRSISSSNDLKSFQTQQETRTIQTFSLFKTQDQGICRIVMLVYRGALNTILITSYRGCQKRLSRFHQATIRKSFKTQQEPRAIQIFFLFVRGHPQVRSTIHKAHSIRYFRFLLVYSTSFASNGEPQGGRQGVEKTVLMFSKTCACAF